MLSNFIPEAAAQKLSKLPGNIKPADVDPHYTGTLYLALTLGRLEGMGYEVLKVMADINFYNEIFTEVMRYLSLVSLSSIGSRAH